MRHAMSGASAHPWRSTTVGPPSGSPTRRDDPTLLLNAPVPVAGNEGADTGIAEYLRVKAVGIA